MVAPADGPLWPGPRWSCPVRPGRRGDLLNLLAALGPPSPVFPGLPAGTSHSAPPAGCCGIGNFA